MAKLGRAEKHIRDGEALVAVWKSDGHRVFEQPNSAGRFVLFAEQLKPIPDELSLIVGDAVQCLRNSLDHIVFILSQVNTPGMTAKDECDPQFPIGGTAVLPTDKRLRFLSQIADATAAESTKARIQQIFRDNVVKKYPEIFKAREAQSIELRANALAFVVSQIQGFSLLASSVDVKGVAYEEIVGSNLRGDRGEFFTPRNACRMAVAMIAPQPGQRLLDPASGTGGFLITGMNYALELLEATERADWLDPARGTDHEMEELYRKKKEFMEACVFGRDLNPNLVRAAKMNMVMNNDGSGGLAQADSLANPHTWEPHVSKGGATRHH